jgi:hypothetical protein
MTLAVVRPDGWNLPLFVHVGGSMVLVGLLLAAAVLLLASLRATDGSESLRLGFRTLLVGAIPAFIVMRVGAEWIRSEENADEDAAWIGIGYMTSDLGALLLIISTVLAGLAVRRGAAPGGRAKWAAGLCLFVVAAYAVALWAMATKPV